MRQTITSLILFFSLNVFAGDIVIIKDTTVTGTWSIPATTTVRFEGEGHISGSGKISGGIIQASLYQNIFDTTLTVENFGTYDGRFSARWFGANPALSNNFKALQKAINTCINTGVELVIPSGEYRYGSELKVATIYMGTYSNCTIKITGMSTFWDAAGGTTLFYNNTAFQSGYALSLQFNKGSEISHLAIKGLWVSPGGADNVYYNIPFASYTDQAVSPHSEYYFGIGIDPDVNQNGSLSGSTGCYFHDLKIEKFRTLITSSRNGVTLNAEIMIWERIQLGDCKLGIQSTQAQEKGNKYTGIFAWGNMHTFLEAGMDVQFGGANFRLEHTNIAGNVIRLFNISEAGWNQISMDNIYAERIGTIGYIQTRKIMQISNSSFHFNYPSQTGGLLVLGTFDGATILFNSCTFEHPGLYAPMPFSGVASYINCIWSGDFQGGVRNDLSLPLGKRIQ